MEPPELHADPVGDRMLPARLTRLARVTSELGRADTVEAVTRTVVAHGRDAVDATMGIMTLLSEDRQTMRLAGLAGSDAANPETWRNYPATARTPSGEAIRTGRRVIAAGRDLLLERFPDMANFRGDSIVVLPLRVDTHTIGAVGLAFAEDRRLTQAELDFLDILADTCAQALGRIAAREAVAEQGAKLAFLATRPPSWRAACTTRRRSTTWRGCRCPPSPTGARSTSSRTAGSTGWRSRTSTPPRCGWRRR